MTEEEYFRKNYPNSCYGDEPLSPHWDFFQDGVEFGERQSEKRIEELEEENKTVSRKANEAISDKLLITAKYNEVLNDLNQENDKLQKENAELKEQNTNLQEMLKTERSVTCKEEYLKKVTELEQENAELEKKNTALRQDWEIMKNTIADYNDFCDKYIKLEKENAELKEKLKPENCLKLLAKEGYVKFTSEQLIKAKELLLELYDCIPSSMADSCKETLQKVALFFKDSEVEK